MSDFEVLSVLVACLALVVSLVTLSAQRKLQREANALQRITADLSQKQLELIAREEALRSVAELSLTLVREGSGYRFLLQNLGPADAINIEIESLGQEIEDMLLAKDEISSKFPVKRLRPNESIRMTAGVYLSSPSVFNLRARWSSPNGQRREEDYAVHS